MYLSGMFYEFCVEIISQSERHEVSFSRFLTKLQCKIVNFLVILKIINKNCLYLVKNFVILKILNKNNLNVVKIIVNTMQQVTEKALRYRPVSAQISWIHIFRKSRGSSRTTFPPYSQ